MICTFVQYSSGDPSTSSRKITEPPIRFGHSVGAIQGKCPHDGRVVVTEPDGKTHWWTFAGTHANLWLAGSLARFVDEASPGDLAIRLDLAADPAELEAALRELTPSTLTLGAKVAAGAMERLQFAEALPESAAERVVVRRLRDDAVVEGGVRVVRELGAGSTPFRSGRLEAQAEALGGSG